MYLLVLLYEISCSLCGYQTWSFVLREEHILKFIVMTRTHTRTMHICDEHTNTYEQTYVM